MKRRSLGLIALSGLVGLALALTACEGFFVSPNSVGSISVSPASGALLATGGTQQLSVTATLVNGNAGGDVTSSSTCSSSNTAVIALDTSTAGSSCLMDAISPGSATVTVSHSGATSVSLPFVVVTPPISQITLTPTSIQMSSTGSSGLPSTVQLIAAAQNQNITNFITTWTAGTDLTVSSTGVLSISATPTIQTLSTVSASLNNSAVASSTVTSNTINVTVNP